MAAALLAGCARFDVDEVIELVPPRSWPSDDFTDVVGAAACWNLGFATQFEVVLEPSAAQVVVLENNPFACWGGTAGVFTPGQPARIDICDSVPTTPPLFLTVLHELGHAAGIRVEGEDFRSVMGSGGSVLSHQGDVFSAEDRALFEDAAGPHATPCEHVRLAYGLAGCRCAD